MPSNALPSTDAQPSPVKKSKAATLPDVPNSEGYIARNVDLRMTRPQAAIFRDKYIHLMQTGATTSDGKPVINRTQALRWVIENEMVRVGISD